MYTVVVLLLSVVDLDVENVVVVALLVILLVLKVVVVVVDVL